MEKEKHTRFSERRDQKENHIKKVREEGKTVKEEKAEVLEEKEQVLVFSC